MRISQIIPSLEEKHGGPSKSVRALSAAQARAGHAVQLLTTQPHHASSLEDHALRITFFRREWPAALGPSGALQRALNDTPTDVIHHHSLWLRTLHYAHTSARQQRVPLIISPRGMMSAWAWQHHAWRKKIARQWVHPGALAAADGWHATSHEEAREIRGLGFNQPICVAPNGVDAPSEASQVAARLYWHHACPEVIHRPVALFYSRFHQKKRVRELIDLWLTCAPADWLLLLVGIPEEYSVAELEAQVASRSAQSRIRVFSGAGRPAPYAVASLFVLPSHNENFGLVIAEAMAHGVPVVVTDTTPWRALATTGHGWCVSWVRYADALRVATAETLTARRTRGENARQWVLREFSWDHSAALLTAFYQTVRRPPR